MNFGQKGEIRELLTKKQKISKSWIYGLLNKNADFLIFHPPNICIHTLYPPKNKKPKRGSFFFSFTLHLTTVKAKVEWVRLLLGFWLIANISTFSVDLMVSAEENGWWSSRSKNCNAMQPQNWNLYTRLPSRLPLTLQELPLTLLYMNLLGYTH